MKKKEIKTIWKLSVNFYIGWFILLILEVLIRLFLKITDYQITCKAKECFFNLQSNMLIVALVLSGLCCCYSISYINKKVTK